MVAVDPPVTATAASDACGIVVAGLGPDGRAYVIDDRTLQGREPIVWARARWSPPTHDTMADRVVAEVNQGGDLVVTVLRQIDPNVAVRQVRATRGKWLRAEPIAALYAEGRVAHVGTLRRARGPDVRVRRRRPRQGHESRPARCAGLGFDGPDDRRRRPREHPPAVTRLSPLAGRGGVTAASSSKHRISAPHAEPSRHARAAWG